MSTYRIRVELDDIAPAIWREVRVRTDLPLTLMHLVLQEAMGWQNAHLYSFRRGARRAERQIWHERPDLFESPWPGTPPVRDAHDATVADLLLRVGSTATYEYDFGDGWEHTLRVLAREEPDDDAPRVLAGERACPPEDSGGAPGYWQLVEDLTTLADDPDAEVDHWRREVIDMTFGVADPSAILARLADFDVEEADGRVRAIASPLPPVIPQAADLADRAEERGSRLITSMVHSAGLGETEVPAAEVQAAMMASITWFLRRVGPEGLTLTSAGYLRPVDVKAVAAQLDLSQEWVGAFNREVQTPQVTDFREALQRLGLVRKAKGRLSVTAAGKRLVDDPLALWQHVAGRLPLERSDFARDAALIVMLDLAGQAPAEPAALSDLAGLDPRERHAHLSQVRKHADGRLVSAISAAGWRTYDGEVPAHHVVAEAHLTMTVLRRCGVVPGFGWSELWAPTEHGRQFLRTALSA